MVSMGYHGVSFYARGEITAEVDRRHFARISDSGLAWSDGFTLESLH